MAHKDVTEHQRMSKAAASKVRQQGVTDEMYQLLTLFHARLTALEESMATKPSSPAIATEVGDLSGRDTSSWTYSPAKEASGPDTTARTSIGDGPNSARTLGSRSEPIFTAEAWREIQTTLTKWVLRWAGGLAEPTPEPNGQSAGIEAAGEGGRCPGPQEDEADCEHGRFVAHDLPKAVTA